MTLLEPLINGLVSYCKWFISAWTDDKFDFNSYFRLVNFCNKEEQYPKVIKTYNGTKGKIYLFNIPVGLSLEDFKKHQEGIKAQLGVDFELRYKDKFIEMELLEKELPQKINYKIPTKEKESIYIPFADSLDGKVYLDLKETPHTLCTGTTGGGKSITTRNIITSIINLYPNEINLYLIDFKIVDLSIFKKLKQTKSYVNDIDEAKEIIADRLEECKRRYKLFEEVGVNNIYDYNKKVPKSKRLKFEFIAIEEFVMLLEDKKKIAMTNLKKLASLSRASGQFLYITAQRFDNTIIDLVLRSVIGNRICHLVESENDSKLIIDVPGANKLRGNGHILFKNGRHLTECQGYYISDEQVREYTKKYLVKYSIKATEKSPKPSKEETVSEESSKEEIVNERNVEPKIENNKITDLSFIDKL